MILWAFLLSFRYLYSHSLYVADIIGKNALLLNFQIERFLMRHTLNAVEEAALTIGYDNILGTGSTTGIVRFKWSDFAVHGTTERLSDYYAPRVIGLGYNVYRVALPTPRQPKITFKRESAGKF